MAKLILVFALIYLACVINVNSEAKPFFFDLLREIFGGSGINFVNILLSNFLYESDLHSFCLIIV